MSSIVGLNRPVSGFIKLKGLAIFLAERNALLARDINDRTYGIDTQVERFSVQGSGVKTPKQRSSKGSDHYYSANAVSPNG